MWSLVKDNCLEFRENWRLLSIDDIQNEKVIIIKFYKQNEGAPSFERTKEIVEEIEEFLFSSQFTYEDEGYRIDVEFDTQGPVILKIHDITPQMNEISIVNYTANTDGVTMGKLAEWFPNAVSIITPKYYDNDIEDIKMFNHLEKLEYTTSITKKEETYILSIFPDIDLGYTEIIGE